MIVYNLKFNKLRTKIISDLGETIINVDYTVRAKSEENENCKYYLAGTYSFSTEDLDPDTFIDFENVSKDVLVDWITEIENVENITELSFVQRAISEVEYQLKVLSEEKEVNLEDWQFTNN